MLFGSFVFSVCIYQYAVELKAVNWPSSRANCNKLPKGNQRHILVDTPRFAHEFGVQLVIWRDAC